MKHGSHSGPASTASGTQYKNIQMPLSPFAPKFAPGQMKDDPDHGFRVCVNALINKCLKPYASTVPLATDEIKKLHGYSYYLQIDGFSAYWSIPVCEESKRLTAFHTPDGIHCWNRLMMQRFQCLGYVWDTVLMKTFVPPARLKEMHRMAKRLMRLVLEQRDTTTPTLKTRVLACFVGRAVATFRGIRGARRYLLYLQHALGQAARKTGWNDLAAVSPKAIAYPGGY